VGGSGVVAVLSPARGGGATQLPPCAFLSSSTAQPGPASSIEGLEAVYAFRDRVGGKVECYLACKLTSPCVM